MDNYSKFMVEEVLPYVSKLAERGGHKFDQIALNLFDHPAPAFGINPHTGELMATTGAINALQGKNLKTISRETKAVLAHEIGHVGTSSGSLARLSVFASPVIAIGAYELIRRYWQNNVSKEDAAKNINDAERPAGDHPWMSDKVFTVAKYVAIGAIGLAAGGFAARHISRAAEFAADKRAIEFTKDPEALVSGLTKLHAAANHAMEGASHQTRGVTQWLKHTWQKFANATYKAHPDLAERIQHIRSLDSGISR
jgi:Zn-dependent protease with chaperone function